MWRFCCGINFFPPLHEKVCQLYVFLFFFCFFLLGWLEFYKIIKCSIIYGARQQKRQKFFKRKKRLLFNAGLQSKKKIRGRVTLVLKELTNKQIFRQHTHTLDRISCSLASGGINSLLLNFNVTLMPHPFPPPFR